MDEGHVCSYQLSCTRGGHSTGEDQEDGWGSWKVLGPERRSGIDEQGP